MQVSRTAYVYPSVPSRLTHVCQRPCPDRQPVIFNSPTDFAFLREPGFLLPTDLWWEIPTCFQTRRSLMGCGSGSLGNRPKSQRIINLLLPVRPICNLVTGDISGMVFCVALRGCIKLTFFLVQVDSWLPTRYAYFWHIPYGTTILHLKVVALDRKT